MAGWERCVSSQSPELPGDNQLQEEKNVLETWLLDNGATSETIFERIFAKYSREYGEEDSGGELLDFSNEAAFEEQVQKLNRGLSKVRADEITSSCCSSNSSSCISSDEGSSKTGSKVRRKKRAVMRYGEYISGSDKDVALSVDPTLTAKLHEKVLKIKKELNWDEEERLARQKITTQQDVSSEDEGVAWYHAEGGNSSESDGRVWSTEQDQPESGAEYRIVGVDLPVDLPVDQEGTRLSGFESSSEYCPISRRKRSQHGSQVPTRKKYRLSGQTVPLRSPSASHVPHRSPSASHVPLRSPSASCAPCVLLRSPSASHVPLRSPSASCVLLRSPSASHVPLRSPSASCAPCVLLRSPSAPHVPLRSPSAPRVPLRSSPHITPSHRSSSHTPLLHRHSHHTPLLHRHSHHTPLLHRHSHHTPITLFPHRHSHHTPIITTQSFLSSEDEYCHHY